MTSTPRDLVLGPGEGKVIGALGATVTFKATSADTAGAYAFCEYVAPPRYAGPPPHLHRAMDEVFYVVEGEFAIRVGERVVRAGPGAFVQVARGTVHTFANPGDAPACFVGLVVPGGWEAYFDELPDLIATHGYPPPAEVLADLSRRYDVVPAPGDR